MNNFVTYYLQCSNLDILNTLLSTYKGSCLGPTEGGVAETTTASDGTVSETGTVFGESGTYYAVVRTPDVIKMPDGVENASPDTCAKLLGVFF